MSPEQAAGQPVIDPAQRTSYRLGATLYELYAATSLPGDNRRECLRQVLEEEPVPCGG